MNEELKDKGLKKAMKEQPVFQLPSNFAYRTMQKVEEAVLLRERKSERRTLLLTIAASLFLIGSCITGAFIFFGKEIKQFFNIQVVETEHISFHFSPICMIIIAIPLFLAFDRWMRKRYFKHHS